MLNPPLPRKARDLHGWRGLFNLTVLSACFYASMEWLFFVTKPSSLSILSALDSVRVLFVTAGTIALISLAALICLTLPAWLTRRPAWRERLLTIGAMVPALVLSITALIMLDNFTYTVFKFGIVSTQGFERALYALGFFVFFWRMVPFAEQAVWARRRFAFYLACGLLAASTLAILIAGLTGHAYAGLSEALPASLAARRPNIIILGSDGLSASYLTAYGSQLQTTPFLRELAKTSLVAENAFPNAGSTTASTAAALTGKEPIEDKVFHYPDVLAGRDSFEHLPGILRQYGYRSVEIGTPHYVDAGRLNLLEGFDTVNDRPVHAPAYLALRAILGNSPATYFIQTIAERAAERLLHILFIRDMENPVVEVNEPAARMSDEERVDEIIEQLDHADQPLFIFVHLMDTHGPRFSFEKQVFSSGSSANEDWDESRYLDALVSFDGHAKRIYEHLDNLNQLNNTVLVIYTDHGFKYATHERIPMLFHFPGNRHAGTRRNNVQVIDIPPTLLDYLGIPAPAWMSGRSLLKGEAPAGREIMTTTSGSPEEVAPPFYQINVVQIIVCQKWYALNVRKDLFESGTIPGHTAPCNDGRLPSDEEAHRRILAYLKKHGYEISSLQ